MKNNFRPKQRAHDQARQAGLVSAQSAISQRTGSCLVRSQPVSQYTVSAVSSQSVHSQPVSQYTVSAVSSQSVHSQPVSQYTVSPLVSTQSAR
jgi:hypothetical protein